MSQIATLIDGPSIAAFLAATASFFLIVRLWTRKPDRARSRIDQLCREGPEAEPAGEGVFGPLTPALAAQIPESAKERRDFRRLLRQAGLYSPTARITIYALRFVLLMIPLVAAGVWAVMAESGRTWQILFAGGMAAAVLSIAPRLYVFFRRRRRMRKIRQGLPDVIDMLSMCSSGGMSLSESLDHVAGQVTEYPELAEELRILRRQTEVGSLKLALADLSSRVDLPEVRQLSGMLTRGTQLGTELAGSLNDQADHLRLARRQAAMTQANKTPVKLVLPILFCFAPAALILLTAPAVLDLRDFLRPGQQSIGGEGFGTGAIFDAMETLDQRIDPLMFEGPPANDRY